MKAKCLLVRSLVILGIVGVALLLGGPVVGAMPPQQGGVTYHTVVRGETLGRIAARYGTSISTLMSWNGITNPNVIYTGQRLSIPAAGGGSTASSYQAAYSSPASGGSCSAGCSYLIAWGDTLSRIAARYGTSVQCLMSANGLGSSNIITGATLRVPCAGGQGTPVVSAPAPTTAKTVPSVPGSVGYQIRSGDTLSNIALLYHTTVQAIMAANGISNPHHIYAGQTLQIPLR